MNFASVINPSMCEEVTIYAGIQSLYTEIWLGA